jgi:hypothetical protein
VNRANGEGASVSEQLSTIHKNPWTVCESELDNLYTWSVAQNAIIAVPEAVLSLDFEFGDSDAEDLFNQYLPDYEASWQMARLYGEAFISLEDGVSRSKPSGVEVACFHGTRQFWCNRALRKGEIHATGGQFSSEYSSVLLPGYHALLRYGVAQAIANNLASKFGLIHYPIPEFLQNMQDAVITDELNRWISTAKSMGILPYDAKGSPPKPETIDIDKFCKYLEACENTVASHLRIPHALLFMRSPSGSTSGRFEIANWVSRLRSESRQLFAAWQTTAKIYDVNPHIKASYDSLLDLYVGREVRQTKDQ